MCLVKGVNCNTSWGKLKQNKITNKSLNLNVV